MLVSESEAPPVRCTFAKLGWPSPPLAMVINNDDYYESIVIVEDRKAEMSNVKDA